MSAEITTFVCVPMTGARLLRTSCASRFVAATREARVGEASLRFPTCRGCVIGKAHKAGESPQRWPDGSPIVEIQLRVEAATVPVTRAAKPKRVEKRPITFTPRPRKVSPAETAPAPFVYRLRRRKVETPIAAAVVHTEPCVDTVVTIQTEPERGLATRVVVRDATRVSVGHAGKAPRWIEVGEIRDTIGGWARRLGVGHTVIVERLRRGWPVELAVTLPKGSSMDRKTVAKIAPPPLADDVLALVLTTLRGLGLHAERVGSGSRGDMFVVRNGVGHEPG